MSYLQLTDTVWNIFWSQSLRLFKFAWFGSKCILTFLPINKDNGQKIKKKQWPEPVNVIEEITILFQSMFFFSPGMKLETFAKTNFCFQNLKETRNLFKKWPLDSWWISNKSLWKLEMLQKLLLLKIFFTKVIKTQNHFFLVQCFLIIFMR